MTNLNVSSVLSLFALVSAGPASSQTPISAQFSVSGGTQQVEISASAPGTDLGSSSTTMYTLGAEVAVGLPIGLHLGAHYHRHFGDIDGGLEQNLSTLNFALGGNELGLFVERQFSVPIASPAKPHLGAGAGYGRVSLGQEIQVASLEFGEFDTSVNTYRVYALGGIDLFGGLELKARVGYMFGSADGDDLYDGQTATLEDGQVVKFKLDYAGLYAAAAVMLLGF